MTGPVPEAILVVTSGCGAGTEVPIYDSLVIGRECRGVAPARRYVIDDEQVSRTHVEVQLDLAQDQAWVVDLSTNGTRLNGSRVERSVPVALRPGDVLTVGSRQLEFRSHRFETGSAVDAYKTVANVQLAEFAMVVGDIASFSTISEYTADGVLLANIDRLYGGLRSRLGEHRGTLSNYVGDAFFATWEIAAIPEAATKAVAFALEAAEWVRDVAPSLALRDPEDRPIRMGWGVVAGTAAVSSMSGRLVSVLGDATNVAFRLSGVAGRSGWSDVVVTEAVHRRTGGLFSYSEPASVKVKGRLAPVTVYAAGRQGTSVSSPELDT